MAGKYPFILLMFVALDRLDAIPMCPIPIDNRFPDTMHVDGVTMCPNGCCNWTLDGCCSGSHVIPQDQLDAVEMPVIIYHGSDTDDKDWHGHETHRRKKRHVEEFTDDEFVDDDDEDDKQNKEDYPYMMGFRMLGIIVVIVGLLNLAYPDHLRV